MMMMMIYWVKKKCILQIKKEALSDSNKEAGLTVCTEDTKYIIMSHEQTAGQITM